MANISIRDLVKVHGYELGYDLPNLHHLVEVPGAGACYKIAAAAMRFGNAEKHGHIYFAKWVPVCDEPVPVIRGAGAGGRYKRPIEVQFLVPCRKCQTCLKVKASLWQKRAVTELAATVLRSWMVTLTFSPVHMGEVLMQAHALNRGSERQKIERAAYRHVQLALDAFRKRLKLRFRYMAVAEYGSETGRLHYHLLLHEVDKPILGAQIEAMWPSFVHKRLVRDHKRQAGYLTKYLTKHSEGRVRASKDYGKWTSENYKAFAPLTPSTPASQRNGT